MRQPPGIRPFRPPGRARAEPEQKRGRNGFGYDPLFYSFELGKTFGEATEEEKNGVSHRARALENLLTKL